MNIVPGMNRIPVSALPSRIVAASLFAAVLCGLTAQAAEKAHVLGIVSERPSEGPFVETEQGFMVPYHVTIPGTKATFEMIPCPDGRFKLGSPVVEVGRNGDEGPQVEIEMKPFWLGKTEVTWKEYKAYMAMQDIFKDFERFNMREITDDRQIDTITAPSNLYDPSFTFKAGGGPDQPAVTMTQYAAKQYTKWLSGLTGVFYRLPTEVEWEYACRAGTKSAYSFGDDAEQLGQYAWYNDNSGGKLQNVAQKKANPWGLFDMHGSVAEWVLDELSEDGYAGWQGKKQTAATAVNWPKHAYPRVVRGGSWEMPAKACRSAARLGSDDEAWKDDDPCFPPSPWWYTSRPATGVGLRVFRPLQPPASAAEREEYWKADHKDIASDVEIRINNEGRGSRGYVDKELPTAMEELKSRQKDRKQKVR